MYGFVDLIYYVSLVAKEIKDTENVTYTQAIIGKDSLKWVNVMQEEMDILKKNETWILVDKPKGQKLGIFIRRKRISDIKKSTYEA